MTSTKEPIRTRCAWGKDGCDISGDKTLANSCFAWLQVDTRRKIEGRISADEAMEMVASALGLCYHAEPVRGHIATMRRREELESAS